MAPNPVYVPPAGLRTHMEDFTEYVGKEHGIKINETIPIDEFPLWFEDASLNYAENIFFRTQDNEVAVVSMDETNVENPDRFTWQDMKDMTAQYAEAMRAVGIKKGDYLVSIGSNSARSLAILLASSSIGSILANFATDIGEKALNDRLEQIRPKLIFAQTEYSYNGKQNNIEAKIGRCFEMTSKTQKCRLVTIGPQKGVSRAEHDSLETFLARASSNPKLVFEQVRFAHPMLVMFSSGTTGPPKGIVHGHGGLTLNGNKQFLLHHGFTPKDVHIHFSGIGWTLWNISLGALFAKTRMILYDGSPFYPSPEKLLRILLEREGVTGFGAGPRYFAELQKADRDMKPRLFAKQLHTIYSTGAVLTSSLARWIAEAFGPVCQLQFSGGTEFCGNLFSGTRSLPSYPGECAVKELGMDCDVFTDDGKSAPEGERGELVCKRPSPNMPVFFLNDEKKERYLASYFQGFEHVWTHGDFVLVNPETKGVYVLGRSDGVLNPSGVRFGSAEIYTVLDTPTLKPLILDSLVVGQQRPSRDDTERVLLFLKCSTTSTSHSLLPTRDLTSKITAAISRDLSRRHVPHFFFEVDEIPYNVNGKKLETMVKKVVNGGREAREKLKTTEDEGRMMKGFERFHEVEQVVKEAEGVRSKL